MSYTIVERDKTYIGPDVKIGKGTVIYPFTHLAGKTVIGTGCRIGPFADIRDSTIEDGAEIEHTIVEESTIRKHVLVRGGVRILKSTIDRESNIGMAHIESSTVGKESRIGHFADIRYSTLGENVAVEHAQVKRSQLYAGVKAMHFSYLGDATVHTRTNVGAGTITCNYDGTTKHLTIIGEGAFVGSSTVLVAPVRVGKDSYTAAGSVITKDVPSGALAIARSRQENKEGWVERRKDAKK